MAYYVLYTETEGKKKNYQFAGWFEAEYSYNDSTEDLDVHSWLKDNIDRGRFTSNSILVGVDEEDKTPAWDPGEEIAEDRRAIWPDKAELTFFDALEHPWLTADQFIGGEVPFSEYAKGWKDGIQGNPRGSYDPDYMMGYSDAVGQQDLMDELRYNA